MECRNAGGNVVTEYTYDAWGNVLSVTGTLSSTIGQINPFRYRGYYYDVETNWYYLQSRYYDPSVGRFLNADKYASTGQGIIGCNMFAYCNNNPIIFADYLGTDVVLVVSAGVIYQYISVALFVMVVVITIEPEVYEGFIAGVVDFVDFVTDALSDVLAPPYPDVVAEEEKTVAEKEDEIEIALQEKLKNVDDNGKTHIHHIVAQSDSRAKPARDILEKVLIHGVNNLNNLMPVSQRVHQRLHTKLYYDLVNTVIYQAYTSAGMDETLQVKYVTAALMDLRLFIEALEACCPK